MALALLYNNCCKVLLPKKMCEPIFSQRRWFAVRKGKRAAMRLLKKKEKKEKTKTEQPTKWVPHNQRGTREIQSIRKRVQEDELKPLPAIDNVWIIGQHVQRVFPLEEAVAMHRETHHPQILNLSSALLHATVELDTRLAKKNRYMENFNGILLYPHLFAASTGPAKTVLALCKSHDQQEAALAAGADMVGGTDLIKNIQKGDIKTETFHYVVAHTDILQELTSIRGLLSRLFPTPARGNLGTNMALLVERFVNGLHYTSKKDTLELDFGWVDAAFGTLDMTDHQLEKNLATLLQTVDAQKPRGTEYPFITRLLVWSPPSTEQFVVPFWEYIEGYQDPRLVKEDQEEESQSS